MKKIYLNFYNKLIKLTRNKRLYIEFGIEDNFSNRLVLLLIHFAFFFKVFKDVDNNKILQEIYDYTFRQLELSIREIGYGDQSINKKMKDYLNLFHDIIDKIHYWDDINSNDQQVLIRSYLGLNKNQHLVSYFNDYYRNLLKNNLNSYLKSVNTD